MTYYKVKEAADGFRFLQKDNSYVSLVADELYTALELQKYHIPRRLVDAVSVSNRETFWSFGSRFKSGMAPDMLAQN